MIFDILNSFLLGVATPLTAVCVIPLYPGFITYLTDQFTDGPDRQTYALFGGMVMLGVLVFMLTVGLLITTVLQAALSSVIQTVSQAVFGLLLVYGLALIAGRNPVSRFNTVNSPEFSNPLVNAFAFGFFFGAIVLPCNPAFLATFLSRSLLFADPLTSIAHVAAFGLGIGAPLFALTIVSAGYRQRLIGLLTRYERYVHVFTGIVMVAVSLYYLIVVF